MSMTKVTSIRLVLIWLFLIGLPALASASLFYSTDRYAVAQGDTIDDDVFLAASEGVVDGDITGDLIIACKDYQIVGEVEGNVNSASQTATIRGRIGRSARMFAQTIIIYGDIGNNLLAFGQKIEIAEDCKIGKDATVFGGEVSISGTIDRDLSVECDNLIISGQINGNLTIKADKISILSPAEIAGNIVYTSRNEVRIGDDVKVGGEVEWKKIEEDQGDSGNSDIGWVLRILLFFASLVTGLFLIAVTNRHVRVASDQIVRKPLVSLGIGFVAFCCIPVAVVVLLALIISIPVGLILLFAYTIFFYIAKIYVAIVIGRLGIQAFRKGAKPRQGWSLLLGLIVLTILFVIPILGWVIYFVVIFWGMGAILLGMQACRISLSTENGTIISGTPPTAP